MIVQKRLALARIAFGAVAVPLLVAGCSFQSTIPNSGSPSSMNGIVVPRGGQTVKPAKHKANYGIGLFGEIGVGDGYKNYLHDYCQRKEVSGSCPSSPGLEDAKFAQSKTLHSEDGAFLASQSGESQLGTDTYASEAHAKSTDKTNYVEGSSSEENFQWNDTLHVTSSGLKKGKPVTINVVLTVIPSVTNVGCGADDLDVGNMTWQAAGATGSAPLSISAGCNNGSFVYMTGNGQQGTQQTGTINTSVGDTVSLFGSGYVSDGACGSFGGTCNGNFTSDLEGTVTWRITGITPGASYTTDSGIMYQQ